MPVLKRFPRSAPPAWAVAAPQPAEWPEFADAISDLSPRDQAVVLGIIRRVEVLENEQGPEVAEATLEQIIGALAKGKRHYLI